MKWKNINTKHNLRDNKLGKKWFHFRKYLGMCQHEHDPVFYDWYFVVYFKYKFCHNFLFLSATKFSVMMIIISDYYLCYV